MRVRKCTNCATIFLSLLFCVSSRFLPILCVTQKLVSLKYLRKPYYFWKKMYYVRQEMCFYFAHRFSLFSGYFRSIFLSDKYLVSYAWNNGRNVCSIFMWNAIDVYPTFTKTGCKFTNFLTNFLFCTLTNKCTINWQIITLLLHVSTLLCYPQGARS
jgi:hypothetical protein